MIRIQWQHRCKLYDEIVTHAGCILANVLLESRNVVTPYLWERCGNWQGCHPLSIENTDSLIIQLVSGSVVQVDSVIAGSISSAMITGVVSTYRVQTCGGMPRERGHAAVLDDCALTTTTMTRNEASLEAPRRNFGNLFSSKKNYSVMRLYWLVKEFSCNDTTGLYWSRLCR